MQWTRWQQILLSLKLYRMRPGSDVALAGLPLGLLLFHR
jgi:hypothetical protein